MNQMKNAFTLIELLAVIVILAIIALIAVPVIMNIIDKANKAAFKDTAYGIIQAGELYFAERQLEPQGMLQDVTITLPDSRLELKGDIPEGSVTITKDGKISIAVNNGRYCITKGIDDKDITITEDIENCKLPGEENNGSGNTGNTGSREKTLTELAVDNFSVSNEDGSNLTVVTKPACLTDSTACAAGTPVAIKVNETEIYNFYVISETDNEVTLIMDRNLGDNVAWYANEKDNSYGPTTAVAALKERISGWTNIPEKEYTYSDDGGGNKYTAFKETMRARMLTYTEATTTLGCKTSRESCPSWLYINLHNTGDNYNYGYWASAAYASSSSNAHGVYSLGYVSNSAANASYGLRPVIELTK